MIHKEIDLSGLPTREEIEQQIREAQGERDVRREAQLCRDLVAWAHYHEEPSLAIESSNKALELYRQLSDAEAEAGVLHDLGHLYAQIGDDDSAKAALAKARQCASRAMNIAAQLVIIHDQALYHAAMDSLSAAEVFFEEGCALATSSMNAEGLFSMLASWAGCLEENADLSEEECSDKITALWKRALAVAEEMRDPGRIAKCEYGLAQVNIGEEDFEGGRKHLDRAIEKAVEAKDPTLAVDALLLQSETCLELSEISLGQGFANQARDIAEEAGLVYEHTRALMALGDLSKEQGEPKEALSFFQKAYRLGEDYEDWSEKGICLHRIGSIQLELGEPDTARENLLAARAMYKKWDDDLGLAMVENMLSRIDSRIALER